MRVYHSREFRYRNNDLRTLGFCEVQVFKSSGIVTAIIAEAITKEGKDASPDSTSTINAMERIIIAIQNVLSKPEMHIDRVFHYQPHESPIHEEFSLFEIEKPTYNQWGYTVRAAVELKIGEPYVYEFYGKEIESALK